MTIAVSLKVHDGLVLASDSATTMMAPAPAGAGSLVFKVYEHACKITNLFKGLPIGCVTWGLGQIGTSSISTLARDLRRDLTDDANFDRKKHTVLDVAKRLRDFINPKWESQLAKWPATLDQPVLGFIVAGYSSGSSEAEEYLVEFRPGGAAEPTLVRKAGETGVTWNGEVEAISRLVLGVDPTMPDVFVQALGVQPEQAKRAVMLLRAHLQAPVVQPAMPIQDAIALARYLVQLTIDWKRFTPGAPTVGGAIEIAAITRHEGFKWVARKHYYKAELNPDDG